MHKTLLTLAAAVAATLAAPAQALTTGDIAFTAFNGDEDGLAFVTFVDLAPGTTIWFSDNEWDGSAFNTGESYTTWTSDATATVAAGTVVRLAAYDKATLTASTGTLARATVSGSANWGIANSAETVYAYLGTDALTPTTFLAAITNGSFGVNGSLDHTGLVDGTASALTLNTLVPSATPDYAEYTGVRTGLSTAAYQAQIADLANWTVDSTNGAYASVVPDTTAFAITTAVPEPRSYALMLAGVLAIGVLSRRRAGR
ncbi:MAG: hypothetical protein RLY78_1357 [Pseudomonadota bacterium]